MFPSGYRYYGELETGRNVLTRLNAKSPVDNRRPHSAKRYNFDITHTRVLKHNSKPPNTILLSTCFFLVYLQDDINVGKGWTYATQLE